MPPSIPPRRERLAAARLYLLATRRLSRLPLAEAVAAACRGGVRVVQVREKEAPDAEVEAIARDLAPAVREAGGLLLVNDRVEAALASGADGVHLGPEDATPQEARRRLGPDLLVGVTTHDLAQANRAVAAGADYVGIGPVFPTDTKGVPIRVVGPEAAARVARAIPVPAFAIGGIAPGNARRLRAEGITRAAACAAILGAGDPEEAARAILAALGGSSA